MKEWKKDAYAWKHDKRMQMHESMIPKQIRNQAKRVLL